MPTLNWCYGAKSPDIEQAVTDAIRAAHRYRNELCRIELDKRSRHEQLLQRLAPEYVEASQAVEQAEERLGEIREAIQRQKVEQRTKTPDCEELTTEAKRLKAELKDLREARKVAKKSAYNDPDVKEAMEENQQQAKEERRIAKVESGLYWGTEAVVRQSCASFSSGAPPRFKRFDGEGQLAVQLQKGLDCGSAVNEQDTRLMLAVPDDLLERLWERGKAPRSMRKAECFLRIGSDGERQPIFARLPIVFHRPLPAGKIKWAYLERRMIADKPHWSVRLTIDVEREPHSAESDEPVAIHVGWRMDDDDLRVATWAGGDGRSGFLRLPARHLADYGNLDETKSKRDKAFNEMRAQLSEWLSGRDVPEWLMGAAKTLQQWKSQRRLAGLISGWRENRFDGDDIFAALDEWRKRDKRRWQHERRLSKRIFRRRKHIYRDFAAKLATRYSRVYLAQIEAKELVEVADPEELERHNTLSARRAKQAAVSELLTILREKFYLRAIETDPSGISLGCANCGERNEPKRRRVQCRGCGRTYDRDENAVLNTLARGEAMVKEGALLELEMAEEDKAKKQQDKLKKMQAANRAARERKSKTLE